MYDIEGPTVPGIYADAVCEMLSGRVACAVVLPGGGMHLWSARTAADWPEGEVVFVPDGQPPLELAIVAVCGAKRARYVAERL